MRFLKIEKKRLENVETTYWCYKSFCIWVTIFPKGLPNLFSILETEVGCEIRLTNIGANRCKKINKGLKEKPSVEFKRHCKKVTKQLSNLWLYSKLP